MVQCDTSAENLKKKATGKTYQKGEGIQIEETKRNIHLLNETAGGGKRRGVAGKYNRVTEGKQYQTGRGPKVPGEQKAYPGETRIEIRPLPGASFSNQNGETPVLGGKKRRKPEICQKRSWPSA